MHQQSSFWYPEKHSNGGGRIRTFEGVSRQIYSLIPLAAREPLRKNEGEFCLMIFAMSMRVEINS